MTCVLLSGCQTPEEKDEQTARQFCSSCHTFPDASLLPRHIWETTVLPQMAFRMGKDLSILSTLPRADQAEVMNTLPQQSMVTEEQWLSIQRYYQKNAPEALSLDTTKRVDQTLSTLSPEAHKVGAFPLHTFIQFDSPSRTFLLGSRLSKLYRTDANFTPLDSFSLESPPSMVLRDDDHILTLLLMGIMDPNDQAAGKLVRLNTLNGTTTTLIDSLRRPVHMVRTDLDQDGLEDYIICSFGNYTGNLTTFRDRGNGTYERKVLIGLPGSRKVIVRDFDNNGKPDILALMSQGDERLILLLNHGRMDFRVTTLLTFPPVYGSSSFDIADFNKDGKWDILYTNGDNADYSITLKPYHGVRVFLNNGNNELKESWFYNMHGASEAVAYDFDEDGDVDIAAVSFFPPFRQHPEYGFMYFENTGKGYQPHTISQARDARWLRINAEDVDADGHQDIILTALDFNNGIPSALLEQWKAKPVSVLVLKNNHK